MTYRPACGVLASVFCVGLCRMAHAENETAASIQVTSPCGGETRCADSIIAHGRILSGNALKFLKP